MGLEKKEFDELLSKFFDDSGIEDPEISIIPDGTRFPTVQKKTTSDTINRYKQKFSELEKSGAINQSCWKVASDTNPVDRRGRDISATLQEELHVDYSLKNIIGQGGFGEVWDSIQTSMGRTVAVKRLKDAGEITDTKLQSESYQELKLDFRREAITTSLLEHPNIVPVHDLGEDEKGRPLLAMKLLKGDTWDSLLRNDRKVLTTPEMIQKHLPILIDVSQAVAFGHSKGIIHRDLKPSQVMVGEYGEVILMDWGIALLYDPGKLDSDFEDMMDQLAPTHEHAVNPAGTPAYMAPEQTKESASDIGPWTDVYLLGGILYYILAGCAPHACGNAAEAFRHASKGKVKPPKFRKPEYEIPDELDTICVKALEELPHDRYTNVQEFIEAVQSYISGSTRKSESKEITKTVINELEGEIKDYQRLNELQNSLIRAINLWPDNLEANNLQKKLAKDFVVLAMENDDLVLARLMLRSIQDINLEAKLQIELEKKEALLRRDKQRRLLLNILIAILVVVLIINVIVLFKSSG